MTKIIGYSTMEFFIELEGIAKAEEIGQHGEERVWWIIM